MYCCVALSILLVPSIMWYQSITGPKVNIHLHTEERYIHINNETCAESIHIIVYFGNQLVLCELNDVLPHVTVTHPLCCLYTRQCITVLQ